jgi:hypothetical protein
MLSPADLPNDIDTLKALLLASERLVRECDQQLAGMAEQLNTRAVEIEHLKLQIAKLRRMQFGRKSEKLDHQIEQLELQLEDLQADEAAAAREVPAADQAPRKKSVRRPLPEHLPREEKVYAPTVDACPACGGALLASWVGAASALLRPLVAAVRPSSMSLRPISVASRPTNEDKFGKPVRVRCSTTWNAGCAPHSILYLVSPTRRRQSCTRSNCGRRCCTTATTAPSRSITRRQNALCVAWSLAAATTCLPAPTAAVSGPPRSTR